MVAKPKASGEGLFLVSGASSTSAHENGTMNGLEYARLEFHYSNQ